MKQTLVTSILASTLLLSLLFTLPPVNAAAGEVTYTIGDSTGDWGYPSPYGYYPRGPGYVRMSFIFDTLVWKDAEGFVPALATDWQYLKDENAHVFHLREEVTWHDGERFTAQDVTFTFTYVKEHPTAWVALDVIERVEMLGEYSVKIYLSETYAPFLNDIAGSLPILPKHIWENIDEPDRFIGVEAVIGTGPYRLVDYSKTHGTYLYEAYEDYYLGKPGVDWVEFVKVSEEMAPASLVRGDVNASSIPGEVVEQFEGEGLTVIQESESWNAKLMINHEKEPLCHRDFRHALAYAVDRVELVEVTQRGHAVSGRPGLLSPGTPWYNPDAAKYEYSPQKAKDILETMGYQLENGYYCKDGEMLALELLTSPRMGFERVAEMIGRQLDDLGIKVNIRSLEWKTLDTKVLNRQFDLAISGHGGLCGDPSFLNRVILEEWCNSAMFRKNQTLNQLLEAQLHEMDEEKRKDVVHQIQAIYAEELPALTLYYPTFYWAHDSGVELYYTAGGISTGIPIPLNKLAFVTYRSPSVPTSSTSIPATDLTGLVATVVGVVAIVVAASIYMYRRRQRR